MNQTDTTLLELSTGEPRVMARLLIEEAGRPPRIVYISPGSEARIGRDPGLEITLDDARVSRQHAVVAFDGEQVTVRDLGSSNGTFVGSARVSDRTGLPPGELAQVGNTRIVVVLAQGTDARPQLTGPVVGPVASGPEVVAVDPGTVALFALVRRLAASDLPVLVRGETGSGKEVVARALHRYSPRAGGPFVGVNCATLPEGLAESELFGHERGSFTGATGRKVGVFEAASGGTLLLDEVGELSPNNQTRLLRALQERVIVRVGATRPTPVDVRVVAATNRDLVADVASGRFREDLYFRLNGITLAVPPLRNRSRDILPLVEKVLASQGRHYRLGPGVAPVLQSYRWPGNVRELRNAIICAVALAEGEELRLEHLPPAVRGDEGATREQVEGGSPLRSRVDELERRSIVAALEHTGWNQSRAARELGISRRALIYKMERYGLKPRPGEGDKGNP